MSNPLESLQKAAEDLIDQAQKSIQAGAAELQTEAEEGLDTAQDAGVKTLPNSLSDAAENVEAKKQVVDQSKKSSNFLLYLLMIFPNAEDKEQEVNQSKKESKSLSDWFDVFF